MGVEAHHGYMFCNTSDVHFGPQFDNDEDCENFIRWCFRTQKQDPRAIDVPRLCELKEEWEQRDTRLDHLD